MNRFTPRIQKELQKYSVTISSDHINKLQNGKSIILSGNVYSGKTLYACQLLTETIKKLYIEGKFKQSNFDFISLPTLFQRLKKDIYNSDSILEYYQNVEYLIIDDIGVEKLSDWAFNIVYLLINYRYEYLKPTVYTTNIKKEKIAEVLDDRIASRLLYNSEIVVFD